jgi:hypothetical protein
MEVSTALVTGVLGLPWFYLEFQVWLGLFFDQQL